MGMTCPMDFSKGAPRSLERYPLGKLQCRENQCAERPIWGWAAVVFREESSKCTGRTLRGKGPGASVKDHRDNVGNDQLPAGTDHNLQRPSYKLRRKRWEEFGRTHEPVGAKTKG